MAPDPRRIAEKARSDRRLFAAGLGELAEVMTGAAGGQPLFVQRTGDPLLDACRQVLSATGVRPGPDAAEDEDPDRRLAVLARQAGVIHRRVTLDGERWWEADAGPLLAFRKDGAPVALLPAAGGGYRLADPATGSTAKLDRAAAETLDGRGYMFFRAFPDKPIGLFELIGFGLHGARRDLVRLLLLGLFGGVLALAVPLATATLVNTVIPSGHRTGLAQLILLLLTATIGVSAFELTRAIALLRIDTRASAGVGAAVMQRLLRLPAPFFRDHAAGDLTERVFGVTLMLQLVSNAMQTAVVSWIFSLASFAFLFTVDWRLGLLTGALVAVALTITVAANAFRLRLERRMFAVRGDIASRVFQILHGIAKLRANGAEKRAFALWATQFARQKTLDLGIRRIANGLEVFNAGYVVLAAIGLYAAISVLNPNMGPGDFAAFNAAFTQFFMATLTMTSALTASLNAAPLYERARPVLTALPEPNRPQTLQRRLDGAIDLSRVTFRYDPDGPVILDDVSLSIRPGEFVAVVGASGSGKSTLFRILLGFETPQSGAVYYDSQDLAGLDLGGVRGQLGVVLQNGKLLPGELYTNIVGASHLTLDDAWAAARLAGMEEDIKAMPMGMHTVIAEGSSVISGGQRQRLMIARAVAARPRLLLFDEATSALDNATQAAVTQSIRTLDATRVVIAHRLSTIIDADRIVVMEAGRLVESGTYAELMALGGRFASLASRQLA
jgi:ATP-binding cassette subfamily C protein